MASSPSSGNLYFGRAVCCALQIPTRWFLFPLLPVIMLIYHKTLKISVWKSVSIFLAVFAVFTCVKSLSRAVNALMTADLHITENELWLHTGAGIFYNVICLLFVLAAWYPACTVYRQWSQTRTLPRPGMYLDSSGNLHRSEFFL